jgi:hypothetical protein
VFIVLDERSVRDETCRVVCTIPERDEGPGPTIARADFYVAVELLIPAEMRTHRLNEGTSEAWRDEGAGFLYTRDRMVELMGSEFNAKDIAKRWLTMDGQTGEWPARLEDL